MMTVTNENVVEATNTLQQKVAQQQETIGRLSIKVGQLTDEIAILIKDLGRFKEGVSTDMKSITKKINK